MKKLLALLLTLAIVFSFAACSGGGKTEETTAAPADETAAADDATTAETAEPVATPENPVIRMATTTSVNDSGLLPYLLPAFEAKTGYQVEVASAGTGVAIGYAKSGDADLLLVHSKKQEEAFIEEGYASTERLSFMYNYFVIVGPADDPAGIRDLESAADCFAAIAEAGTGFASRGDNSGTHNKETGIWEAAEIDPTAESWYYSLGSGMGDTLTKANELGVYTLTDKATYLSMKDSLPNLTLLKEEADDMKNTYSLLGVNPDAAAFADTDVTINTEGANALIDWMLSDEAAALIAEYGVADYGEPLFFLLNK